MPINFSPDYGQILMCDFTTGFERPEMQKVRHCIVVSPKVHTGTCLIVPLSVLPPRTVENWHYLLPQNSYRCMAQNTDIWAKADMLTHAGFQRLNRPKENHVEVRRILQPLHLREVLKAIVHAINCGHVEAHI